MNQPPLTFEKLREANLARCESHFHPLRSWNALEWACCLAGEVGELCNFIKKRKKSFDKKTPILFRDEIKKEIGDALSYLDLLAANEGLTLEECIRDKFNEVSIRIGAPHRL